MATAAILPSNGADREVSATGRLLDAHALPLAGSTAGAEAGASFGPCAASELYGDEVKQRFWGRAVAWVVSSEADQGDA
jgi:hypothetical protein